MTALLLAMLLTAGIEPPALQKNATARYPPEHFHLDAGTPPAGEVKLSITVDVTGAVEDITVLEATDDFFAREAVHAATRLEFTPALDDGRPVAVQLSFNFHFEAPVVTRDDTPERTAVLRGVVRSTGTRRPIGFARVTSDDGAKTETDVDGKFTLPLEPGKRWIWVQAPGFKQQPFQEDFRGAASIDVIYPLEPTMLNPFETVVRDTRERTETARVSLRGAEIREVPGTLGDPFRVVMLMPGVGSVISGLSYPVVRGSSPASTGYFIDTIRVPQLFHVFLGPAVVHPDFLDGIDFFAGGAPVRYGRLLGGVVEGHVAKPRGEFHAAASADLLNAGAFVTTPLPVGGGSITAAGRYSYTAAALALVSLAIAGPDKVVANFGDYQVKIDQPVLGGTARFFAFGSLDEAGTAPKDPSTGRASNTTRSVFHRVDLRYRHPFGRGEGEVGFTYGRDDAIFDTRKDVNGQPDVSSLDFGQRTWIGRVKWAAELDSQWSVELGTTFERAEAFNALYRESNGRSVGFELPLGDANLFGTWLQLTRRVNDRLRVVPGIRLDSYFISSGKSPTGVDPRIAAFYDLTPNVELHAAAGLFHQSPTLLITLPVLDVTTAQYGLQEMLQLTAGTKMKLPWNLELSVDAYVNPLLRSLELDLGGGGNPADGIDTSDPNRPRAAPILSTTGLAYGLEAMLRFPQQGHFFGWLTASLSRSQRRTTFLRRNGTFDTQDLAWSFDQTFIANAVGSYRFDNGWSLGLTVHFNTGRPEDGVLGSQTSVQRNGTDWEKVDRDQVDRLPPFFRIDLRASKTWLTKNLQLELYLDVLNVLVRNEVIGFTYDSNGKTAIGVPVIVPTLGFKGRY